MAARDRFRAAVLTRFGAPFEVRVVEVEPPEEWVPVEVRAVGVCGRDVVVWRGGFRNLRPPLILGHEVFGYHDGEPVGVFPAVIPEECVDRPGSSLECPYQILGEHVAGGYAERVYVPPWLLVRLPDSDFPKYAASVCGVATMIHAARVAGIGPGSRVLVTGASGGVGVHGIQYLALLGARVYAYTRSPEKAELLESLGVRAVTSLDFYRSEGRVDAVVELVGARTINESMRALRPGGNLVLVGNVTGEPVAIERPALFVMREIHMHGSAAYDIHEYRAAVKLAASGAIRPFYRAYSLEEINNAYRDVLSGSLVGRAVITP
ncbi:MAG: zinc-binding dehydrogenase [Desulfurococcales archaeon]|nr:zinc-binding dehydrogenase [Desulfurococcales archaeon]